MDVYPPTYSRMFMDVYPPTYSRICRPNLQPPHVWVLWSTTYSFKPVVWVCYALHSLIGWIRPIAFKLVQRDFAQTLRGDRVNKDPSSWPSCKQFIQEDRVNKDPSSLPSFEQWWDRVERDLSSRPSFEQWCSTRLYLHSQQKKRFTAEPSIRLINHESLFNLSPRVGDIFPRL
ncbi:hypothetical protein JTE90_003920 [Oedothorax gibbosus]|uniref:Uncharacterized protein n=1 Tax=Oedothorax gibbosus TaxID=931172 RepID=A0AAV6TM19_9ARAC|nr:hypothetical protein JTE90_003920 [Oedothorax gibbosus]